MFYEPSKGHGLRHDPFKNLVVPRPIGWISSLDAKGVANLAPFSFYNAICLEPPMVVFGLDLKPGGQEVKDTLRNIEETHEFVVNLPTWGQREALLKTATHAPHGTSEFELAGLGRLPSRLVKPPRVEGAPAHLECRHLQTTVLPHPTPNPRNFAILGEVIGVHIDDALIKDGMVDIVSTRPLARLGYLDYTAVDSVFSVPRPD